jgi:hypothetical protein
VPVNIHKLGGKSYVAVTDAPVQIEFDPLTLKTIGRKCYLSSIVSPGGIELFSTAHPHLIKDRVHISDAESKDAMKYYSYNYFLEMRPLPIPGVYVYLHYSCFVYINFTSAYLSIILCIFRFECQGFRVQILLISLALMQLASERLSAQ